MKYFTKNPLLIFLFALSGFLAVQALKPANASAAYDGGRIIDNSVFLDSKSMNINDVQNFLSSKGGQIATKNFVLDCDGAGTQAKQAYLSLGAPCGRSAPASNIIYYAAQVYGISPKVVLATLQKEQSLVTAVNPTDRQYAQAMGYACPTSGSCSDTSNFFYQIDNGTWVLRFHMERARGNNNWWYSSTTWTCGTEKNFYKPNLYPGQNVNFFDEDGVMYRTHFIANAATSSMYCYTPHAYNNPQGLYGRAPYGTTGRYYSGSYNFVYFFELWFGSTQTNIPYAWKLINQQSFANSDRTNPVLPSILAPGQIIYVRIKAQNMGYETWSNSGNSVVRVGTNNQRDRISSACTTQWLSCNRAATLKEASVAPGEIGTFEFEIKAQSDYQISKEYFNLLAEGKTWMNDLGLFWQLETKVPTAVWSYESQAAYGDSSKTKPINPSLIASNTVYTVVLRARNTGNTTWSNTGNNPVRLGTSSPRDRTSQFCNGTWLSCNRAATLKEASVAPGEIGTFEFQIKSPSSIGIYNEYFTPVVDGVGWMNDVGMNWRFEIKPPIYEWQPETQLMFRDASRTIVVSSEDTIQNGSTIYATIKVKNTGNTTWSNTGNNPVRLGTSSPRDRTSQFCNGTWLSCNRAATLKEASVAPGEIGTFEFSLQAPLKENSTVIKEYFTPLAEGRSWMNDVGFYYSFTFNSPVNTWQYISQGSYSDANFSQSVNPSTLSRNTTYYLRLKALNTSGKIWSKSITNLGTNNPQDRISSFCTTAWLSCTRATSLKETTVAPGETGTFDFPIITPLNPGTYNEYFRPVIEGQTWMVDVGLFWGLTVN